MGADNFVSSSEYSLELREDRSVWKIIPIVKNQSTEFVEIALFALSVRTRWT